MPNLPPMPPSLKRVSMDYVDHFSRNSVSCNSVLALGATGVDKGDYLNRLMVVRIIYHFYSLSA